MQPKKSRIFKLQDYELHRYIFDPNGEKGVFLLISVDVSLICLKEMERPRNVLKNVSQHFSVL